MSTINNDPFEEFEFRPINEGLGFHRKQKGNQSASSLTSSATTSTTVSKSTVSKPVDLTEGIFKSPLPRPEARPETRSETKSDARTESKKAKSTLQIPTVEDDSIAKAQTAVNDILKSLNQKRQLDFAAETAKQKAEYKKSKPQLFAAVLDGMLITAAFLMSLILMLVITKVDLFMNLSHPQTSQIIYLATLALFAAVTFIYMVVNRAFLGYTPGEWAFDQVCGKENQSEDLSYIPKLVFRTLFVMATGFVILPFLSYLFNKDIAGEITGVSLFKKPNV